MKRGLRNQRAKKGLIMAIFKLLVLLYAHYPIRLFEQYGESLQSVKIQVNVESTTMDLTQL